MTLTLTITLNLTLTNIPALTITITITITITLPLPLPLPLIKVAGQMLEMVWRREQLETLIKVAQAKLTHASVRAIGLGLG